MMGGVRIPVLYLDTSVLGGYFDEEWKEATQELFRQMEMGLWKCVSSDVIAEEIEDPFGNDANDLPMTKIASNIKKHVEEIL